MYHLIPSLIELFAKFPKIGGLFGLLVAIFFSFVGLVQLDVLRRLPDKPEQLTLTQIVPRMAAGQEVWAEIDKVNWDCANIVYSQVNGKTQTEAVFTDDALSVLGIAEFTTRVTCDDLVKTRVSGTISRMGDRFFQLLPQRGFNLIRYQNAVTEVYVCTICGRGNSLGLLVCSAVFVPLGLAMYPMCLLLTKYWKRTTAQGTRA